MQLLRMRFEIDDSPGSLGRIATALGELHINILEFDLHSVDDDMRVDEMLIRTAVPLDLPAIAHELHRAGCRMISIGEAAMQDLTDPITRSLRLASAARLHADRDVGVAEAAEALVRADLSLVMESAANPFPLVDRVRSTGVVQQDRAPCQLLGPAPAAPWCLAVPFPPPDSHKVMVLLRRTERFTHTEIARVQALLLATADDQASAPGVEADRHGLLIRSLTPADVDAYALLHTRCSAETRYNRYFIRSQNVPARILDKLVEEADRHIGLGAFEGTSLVATAHAQLTDDGERAEVAVLVEDARQRSGIGTELIRSLAAALVARHVGGIDAITLPGNPAIPALLAAAGLIPTTIRDDDLVRVSAQVGDAQPVG